MTSNDLNHSALVLIDLQEDFFKTGGNAKNRNSLVQAVEELREIFDSAGSLIVWVRQEWSEDLSDAETRVSRSGESLVIKGSFGASRLKELNRRDGELEVIKKRFSSFFQTDLDQLLRSNGIQKVYLAGVNTHACVMTSAIDAYQLDYEVFLCENALSSHDQVMHRQAFHYLTRYMCQSVTNESLIKADSPRPEIFIQKAGYSDARLVVSLIHELSEFENLSQEMRAIPDRVANYMGSGFIEVFFAYHQDVVAGFALVYYNFSTFEGEKGLYLEDLYVKEEFRGLGIGKKLFHFLKDHAKKQACKRMEWVVLDWNKKAREFYRRENAREMQDWILNRIRFD